MCGRALGRPIARMGALSDRALGALSEQPRFIEAWSN